MKAAKKNNIAFRLISIFLILTLFIVLIIYKSPRKIEVKTIATSNQNSSDTVDITLFLTKSQYLFSPTRITGKIIFNETEYVCISSLGYDSYSSNSFWKNLQLKIQGFSYDLFVRSDLKGSQTELLKDTITIESLTDSEVIISKSDSSTDSNILYTISIQP